MHALGGGYAIIPMVLGFGCTVPAAMATRVLESSGRNLSVPPCFPSVSPACPRRPLVGLIGGLAGSTCHNIWSSLCYVAPGGICFKHHSTRFQYAPVAEIPPYRFPHPAILGKKVWMRVRAFLAEAVPYVLLGVLFINLLFVSGFIDLLGEIFAPFLSGLFGLPPEAIAALLMGFLRKDVAVGMLSPLGLSVQQLVVAAIVLTAYFPCAATFIVLLRELGPIDMLKSTLIMLIVSFGAGGLTNLVLAKMVPAQYIIIGILVLIALVYSSARAVRAMKSRREDLTL